MVIQIKNAHCKNWNNLDEKERVKVSTDGITKLVDLLAKVLINSTRILLKRGIDRSYLPVAGEIGGIKGKLAISETLKTNLIDKQKTICEYDEFSPNVLLNQILFTTLLQLMRTKSLDPIFKKNIRSLIWMFPDVKPIEIRSSLFSQIRFSRNNRFYLFVMNICQLIHDRSLPSQETGYYDFIDFTRDEVKMHRVFENFVFNFFKLEQTEFQVRREQINWQFSVTDPDHLSYVPNMLTDITLQNPQRKIIIDTKYYSETLARRFETKKVKSANLYQLFSYLLNQEDGSERNNYATGILLYPTIDEDYNLEYCYRDHKIFIKTINLNENWCKIEGRLKSIIPNYKILDSDVLKR
jgi:5-methylcytosine-specific restriction enzyme subunit McrC